MREYLTAVAGNAALRRRLGAELESDSFSHAYLLEGPAGCGKSTLALELVKALACENRKREALDLPCGSCPTCQKIAAGNSPDVIHIRRERDKATMGVETVRALRSDVITVPNDLSFKVYIIHDAHTMTVQAQNALLLTLEEPPAFVRFILLTEDAGALLETIRSRAPILRMQPIDEQEIKRYLLSSQRDRAVQSKAAALQSDAPEELAALLRMAGGRIGKALELLDEGKRAPLLENRAVVSEICRLLMLRTHPDELLAALLSLGNSREDVCARLSLLKTALRDLLVLSYSEAAPLLFFTDEGVAQELSSRFTAKRLLAYTDAVERTLTALAANGNVRLLLIQLLNALTQS